MCFVLDFAVVLVAVLGIVGIKSLWSPQWEGATFNSGGIPNEGGGGNANIII